MTKTCHPPAPVAKSKRSFTFKRAMVTAMMAAKTISQRGATSVSGGNNLMPAVMVNESPSSLDVLGSMRTTDVTLVQFMSGADATTLYGTGYVNGLIKVRTGPR